MRDTHRGILNVMGFLGQQLYRRQWSSIGKTDHSYSDYPIGGNGAPCGGLECGEHICSHLSNNALSSPLFETILIFWLICKSFDYFPGTSLEPVILIKLPTCVFWLLFPETARLRQRGQRGFSLITLTT